VPALRGYDLDPVDHLTSRPAEEPRTEIEQLGRLRRAGRYATLGAAPPALLEELTLARHTAAGDRDREQVFGLLVAAFYTAHGLAYRLGYADLAESIEHR